LMMKIFLNPEFMGVSSMIIDTLVYI
jgi:hypothetical protein